MISVILNVIALSLKEHYQEYFSDNKANIMFNLIQGMKDSISSTKYIGSRK